MDDSERELDELLMRQREDEDVARARIGISLERIAFSQEEIVDRLDQLIKLLKVAK